MSKVIKGGTVCTADRAWKADVLIEGETIKQRMASERDPVTGAPLFNLASGISLLLFYAFAMQCMSTLAVVKRETNSWYWPAAQLVFMSLIAYVLALIAYQTLS